MLSSIETKNHNTIDSCDCHNNNYYFFVKEKNLFNSFLVERF